MIAALRALATAARVSGRLAQLEGAGRQRSDRAQRQAAVFKLQEAPGTAEIIALASAERRAELSAARGEWYPGRVSFCLNLAFLACLGPGLGQDALASENSSSASVDRTKGSDLVLPASRGARVAFTRAYVLQELERNLRSLVHRWAQAERRRGHGGPDQQLRVDRHKLAATLRVAELEARLRRTELRHSLGRGVRLARQLASPDEVFVPKWLWRSRDDRKLALEQAFAAAAQSARLAPSPASTGDREPARPRWHAARP